ncbi:MAG: hypothetical protein ABSC13_03205 [Dehalococcoidia bacterium]|jgi:hypothetical protein
MLGIVFADLFFMARADGPYADVTFVNQTGGAISLYENDTPMGRYPVGETTFRKSGRFWGERLSARDDTDSLVWQADITWDQLKEMGYRIVIEAPASTPTILGAVPNGRFSPE